MLISIPLYFFYIFKYCFNPKKGFKFENHLRLARQTIAWVNVGKRKPSPNLNNEQYININNIPISSIEKLPTKDNPNPTSRRRGARLVADLCAERAQEVVPTAAPSFLLLFFPSREPAFASLTRPSAGQSRTPKISTNTRDWRKSCCFCVLVRFIPHLTSPGKGKYLRVPHSERWEWRGSGPRSNDCWVCDN